MPSAAAKGVYIVAGRRSGKSHNVAMLGTYMAAFRQYDLARGGACRDPDCQSHHEAGADHKEIHRGTIPREPIPSCHGRA